MPEGTPIYAAQDGVVIYAQGKHSKYGKKYIHMWNGVEILHKNLEVSDYVHLKYKGVVVKVGEYVRKGQLIRYSGQTGYATYPHLHFSVYTLSINPEEARPLIPRFKSSKSKLIKNKVSWRRYS